MSILKSGLYFRFFTEGFYYTERRVEAILFLLMASVMTSI